MNERGVIERGAGGRPDGDRALPIVLAVDVEPDPRVFRGLAPEPSAGFEALVELLPGLRDRIADVAGAEPRFTWTLRMDPQMAQAYGSTSWIASRYESELAGFVADGDELGLHTHTWRWNGERWVGDNADEAWLEHCFGTALESYRSTFGRPARANRNGDRFTTNAVVAQLSAAGVRVDLTVEPGLPAARSMAPGEPTTGLLPSTEGAPTYAYHPHPDDFCRPYVGASRDGLLMVPLTPGVIVGTTGGQSHGTYETLVTWMNPLRFERLLRRRLGSPELTHLAFAVRSDSAGRSSTWDAVETNLLTVARLAKGQWLTASEAGDQLRHRRAVEPVALDASAWAGGRDDPGHRERIDARGGADHDRIAWCEGETEVACPVCEVTGAGDAVARTLPVEGASLLAGRCRSCASIAIAGVAEPPAESGVPAGDRDPYVDDYVEYHAAIEVLAALVARAGERPGARVLEIGCGYGFGLDVGRVLWGWQPVGVDPGRMAARGSAELGFPLVPAAFDGQLDLGPALFDVVVASEVIEHVADPRLFLRDVSDRMHRDAVLVLCTPDASAIDPTRSPAEAIAVIGAGEHVFLFSASALDRLLHDAGFGAVRVERNGAGLWALACPTPGGLDGCPPAGAPDLTRVAGYCAQRRESAPVRSALRVGMAARVARYALVAGDLPAAVAAADPLRVAIDERYGVDLGRVTEPFSEEEVHAMPVVVADALFTLATLDLLHHDDPALAATRFGLAAEIAAAEAARNRNAALRTLQVRALAHEAVALARSNPPAAAGAVQRARDAAELAPGLVDVDVLFGRVFTDLVASGSYDAATAVGPFLAPLDERLAGEADDFDLRRTALDVLFSAAMLAYQRGDLVSALAGFRQCAIVAGPYAESGDGHAAHLADVAGAHAQMAGQHLMIAGAP
ncbi:MAG: class I SAM-dependent methyltransferase [Actinobacteria bacterium]|nr:class I SAM-dependent methyltransferase [Actinomycetota bacterium]